MICLLMHNVTSADTLLKLLKAFGEDWFPATVGFAIVRPMFEVDVTAHYMSQNPAQRASQYIKYSDILKKRQMDACYKHRQSKNSTWGEAMSLDWNHYWASRKAETEERYRAVASSFQRQKKGGGLVEFKNWSGRNLREMAVTVNHEEAYDILYADLSSFAHADVRLADRFLKIKPTGPFWSCRADELDVVRVFQYAANFLACFMELFCQNFSTWTKADVKACWDFASPAHKP